MIFILSLRTGFVCNATRNNLPEDDQNNAEVITKTGVFNMHTISRVNVSQKKVVLANGNIEAAFYMYTYT